MIFSQVKNESDIEKLKKRIAKDPELSARIATLRQQMNYTKSGRSRATALPGTIGMPTKAELLALYRALIEEGKETPNKDAELALRKIKTKSNSGVAVVSVLTKPFPCPGRCTYCPTEERMPKSYLEKEPAAARALANDFDPYLQVTNRLKALSMNGHPVDKIELIVIGGTWSFYHPVYQEEFLIGCYRACNDWATQADSRLEKYDDRFEYLNQLQERNEEAHARMIGLSIETRPDYITAYEVVRLRKLGVTKVEIGVQHLDDDVLRRTKRDMKIDRVVRATELLRNAGFKIVYHMMPDLPGSTKERDVTMFRDMFNGKDFHPDMLKIYPCMVLEGTELFKEFERGEYVPYTDQELINVLAGAQSFVPPYVRILRVIRDIPATYIKGGSHISNLREEVERKMKEEGRPCVCIRCREIREEEVIPEEYSLHELVYETNTGKEYFLSFENDAKRKLASFTRLRLPDKQQDVALPVLADAALIRELHTYGRHTKIGVEGAQGQHVGFGRKLLARAEEIARNEGYKKLAVISGIGVRAYYRKLGYALEGTYMVKYLS